ncbi:cold-shock protein [Agrococcus sp. SGAir0287]|uniref:cold-shock protein n=1 Tax=Agrococcus sp. SGAir0287 TaxID=2070347 RepID=UPI0010CD4C04|nr:cold shock domain-containing protein [Agrococcus sp. SGAir0287]QCR18762.1 hypothetical protein C1N71_04265 [Agrococcus sp. SGAir0287]
MLHGDALGTVVEWHDDEGWGLVALATSGAEVWAHFSIIEHRAFGSLEVGEEVRVWYQPGPEAGALHAVRVVPTTNLDDAVVEPEPPGEAYRSSLTVVEDPDRRDP